MIVVSEPFVYNINVKPACLPKFPIKPGNICYATGLGKTKDIQFLAIDAIITQQKFPKTVETVDLVIHDLEQCYNSHMQTNVSTYFAIRNNNWFHRKTVEIAEGDVLQYNSCKSQNFREMILFSKDVYFQLIWRKNLFAWQLIACFSTRHRALQCV